MSTMFFFVLSIFNNYVLVITLNTIICNVTNKCQSFISPSILPMLIKIACKTNVKQ